MSSRCALFPPAALTDVRSYFNQPRPGVAVQGPALKYPPQTAKEYIVNAMHRNYLAGQQMKKDGEKASTVL